MASICDANVRALDGRSARTVNHDCDRVPGFARAKADHAPVLEVRDHL